MPLIAVELVERGGEPARIARELGALQIGVELARAREGELQQAAEGGREVEEQQRRQRDVGIAQQPRRQVEDRQDDRQIGEHLREAGHHVGQRHHREVVVAHMAQLMRQHAGQLAHGEPPQQALGDADDGVAGLPRGKRVERHAGDDVERRRCRQPGPPGELVDDVGDLAAVLRVDALRPVHAHDHLGRQARGEDVERGDPHQRHQHAGPGPQQPRREGGDEAQPAHQQDGMQLIARLVRAASGVVEKRRHGSLAPQRWTAPAEFGGSIMGESLLC